MKFSLTPKENIYNFMRHCGYYSEGSDEKTGQLVFVRQLDASDYPRFHAYVEVSRETPRPGSGQAIEVNLHLDQKKPIYEGSPAHAAEYEGEVVEREVERIKKILGL